MAWNTPEPSKPPGEWYEYSTGMDYRGYVLECGPLFHVHIVSSGGEYHTQFNNENLAKTRSLKEARQRAEAEVVHRVRTMLPAYRVIFARFQAREEVANVTPIRPLKD